MSLGALPALQMITTEISVSDLIIPSLLDYPSDLYWVVCT